MGCGDRRWGDGAPYSQGRRGPVGGVCWQVEVGVVVVDMPLKCWWQGLLKRLVEQWCFSEGCVGREVLM